MTGFLAVPRVPFTIDGKGRRGREAGNNEFRMVIGRAGCREGDIVGDESGDETRGRFVLIVSDMIRVVSERIVEVTAGVRVQCGRENARVFGGVVLALEKVGKKVWRKRARPYKRMCVGRSSLSSLCWGPRTGWGS